MHWGSPEKPLYVRGESEDGNIDEDEDQPDDEDEGDFSELECSDDEGNDEDDGEGDDGKTKNEGDGVPPARRSRKLSQGGGGGHGGRVKTGVNDKSPHSRAPYSQHTPRFTFSCSLACPIYNPPKRARAWCSWSVNLRICDCRFRARRLLLCNIYY